MNVFIVLEVTLNDLTTQWFQPINKKQETIMPGKVEAEQRHS